MKHYAFIKIFMLKYAISMQNKYNASKKRRKGNERFRFEMRKLNGISFWQHTHTSINYSEKCCLFAYCNK